MRNRSIRNQQGSLQGTGADTAGREQSDGRTGAYDRYGRNCAGAGRDGKHREKTDLVIEVETDNSVESGAQEIQPNPEKTEDEKPQEPPVLAEDADVTNPDTKPAYEEEPEKSRRILHRPWMTHRKQETLRTEWYMWKDSDGYLMRVPVLGLPQMTCMKTVIK